MMKSTHIILLYAVLSTLFSLFLTGCDSCRDCIVAIKDLEMPQDDGSLRCLYFGEFNKFVYEPIYSTPCPDTLHIKRKALQNKGIMGLTFVNGWFIEHGTVFYALPLCKAEQDSAITLEYSLGKFSCQLLR